jgi:hypothetical protein
MELYLYHTQGIIYYFLLGLLIIRILLNIYIYYKIDSDIIQRDIPFYWTMIPFSENEKRQINVERNKWKRGEIKDFTKDGSDTFWTNLLHCALTFWWPLEVNESSKIRAFKRLGNFLNLSFLVIGFSMIWFFLYMQDINARHSYIERDWTYIFRELLAQ